MAIKRVSGLELSNISAIERPMPLGKEDVSIKKEARKSPDHVIQSEFISLVFVFYTWPIAIHTNWLLKRTITIDCSQYSPLEAPVKIVT